MFKQTYNKTDSIENSFEFNIMPHLNVLMLHKEMSSLLANRASLLEWIKWLDDIVAHYLKNYNFEEKLHKAARTFMLRWAYYR